MAAVPQQPLQAAQVPPETQAPGASEVDVAAIDIPEELCIPPAVRYFAPDTVHKHESYTVRGAVLQQQMYQALEPVGPCQVQPYT